MVHNITNNKKGHLYMAMWRTKDHLGGVVTDYITALVHECCVTSLDYWVW